MDILAIDLGTSNTVAMLRGAPLLFDGREQLSSAVYADPGGFLVAGLDAERLARADPAAFEPNPKRRIDDGTILLGARTVEVADALAAVLSTVLAQIDPTRKPEQTVLTVPSGWGATRRAVLTTAAERAGLRPVALVSEPIAAAAYYTAVLGHELPPDAALLVVDMGAGTADAALVRNATVVAQRGLDVGGLDIDAALVDILAPLVSRDAPELWGRLTNPKTGADRRDRLALWQEVRAAKESLSRLSVAPIHVPGYAADLHLTREEVETAATKLLSAIADLAAELAPPDLSDVLLVGGGSRMPLLGRLLHTRLGVAPSVVERPEMAVVEGALHTVAPAQPAAIATDVPRTPIRRRRWLSPVTLVLALLCFVLPFATVSCGLPDGYGHAKPGGTTAYNGLDLALGGAPDVPDDQKLPASNWRPDRLNPQPLYVIGLLLVGAGLVAAAVLKRDRRRRAMLAGLGGLAAVSLVTGQALVVDQLAARIRQQSAIPAGKVARDFVGTGPGFWLTVVLLALLVAGNLFALRRRRH